MHLTNIFTHFTQKCSCLTNILCLQAMMVAVEHRFYVSFSA